MDTEFGASRIFVVLWASVRRLTYVAILVMVASVLSAPSPVSAAPSGPSGPAKDRSTPVRAATVDADTAAAQSDGEQWAPPRVVWPTPGASEVALDGAGRVQVGQRPVTVARAGKVAAGTAPVDKVRVEVLDRSAADAAGVSGVLLTVARVDGAVAAAPVSVEVDYSGFRHAFGSDWARRLTAVRLPSCALTSPAVPQCRAGTPLKASNDVAAGRMRVQAEAAPELTSQQRRMAEAEGVTAGDTATVLAVTAAAVSSDTGTFDKTPMRSSSSWSAGMPSGDFSYAYPLEVPPAPGELEPEVELSYSSGAVDGRTNAENAQTSWIGEGWDYEPGYIERSYRSCKDDVTDSTPAQYSNATNDQCWRDQNATLVWNGRSTELVLDDAAAGGEVWRLAEDDGSRIQRLTGQHGYGQNGETWRLTTPDGTQFHFGKQRLPGWTDGGRETRSVRGVPVFHNRTGEPCYKTGGFAGSWCFMAYRWNLDWVVDPHGNSMTYWYGRETSNTGLAGTGNTKAYYDRGGFLERIEYGTRSGTEFATTTPPMKVDFTVGDRCLSACRSGTTPTAANWPDTPWDLQCSATTCPNNVSPSFWTDKRLTKVTTSVRVNGAYQAVDEYAFSQGFPATNDTTDPSLWLFAITRTGKDGTASAALPEISFAGSRYANRTDYNTSAAVPQVYKYRITRISNETGGDVLVTYEGSDCTVDSQANPDNNAKRCFPQYYAPPDTAPGWAWWNKYRVSQVIERDKVAGSPDVVQTYAYSTAGSSSPVLWHHNDTAKWSLPLPKRTWSDWRGWPTVTVTTGAAGATRTKTVQRYFRGLDADRTDAGETARQVTLTDSHGQAWPDADQRAGALLEEIRYAADGTTALQKTRYVPWEAQVATRTELGTHVAPAVSRAYYNRLLREETFDYLAGSGSWRESETEYAYDATYGQEVREIDRGQVDVPDDDVCTSTTYARNTTTWLIDYPAAETTTNCAATPGPDDVLAEDRTYYDGNATLGAAPTRGLPTRTEELDDYRDGAAVYATTGTAGYDVHGRVTSETDGLNHTTTTTYTPATGGPVTAVTETPPMTPAASWATTTTLEPRRGQATAEVDPNGKTTTAAYDPLGRLLKVWLPGRATSQTPHTEYAYTVTKTAATTVRTRTLGPNGNQIDSYEISDGFLNPRQTQDTAPDGKRVISDTRYDSRGLTVTESELYNNASGPTGTLVTFTDADVPTQNRYEYDALERVQTDALWARGTKKWDTTTSYDGDRITVTPPRGDTPTTTLFDVDDNPVKLRQYKAATATGAYDETSYSRDRLGRLTAVTDPAGNPWTYRYDRRGRTTSVTDPDTGTTVMVYDNADQLISTTDSEDRTLARVYDPLGRLTELRDGSATGSLRTSMVYDTLARGQLTSATRHHGGQQYTHTVTGYSNQYDPTGITTRIPVAHTGLAGDYTTGLTYNDDGSLATMAYPAAGGLSAETVTHTYSNTGYLSRLAGADTYLASADYYWHGAVKQRLLGSATKRIRLDTTVDDATDRLTQSQVSTERPGTPDAWDAKLTERYTYDDGGAVTAINEINPADGATVTQQCFQHDYLRRLTEAWTTTAAACPATPTQAAVGGPDPYWQSFTYDLVGNRTTDTTHATTGDTIRDYTTPAAKAAQPHTLTGRATRGGGPATSYTYDKTGNLTTRTTGTVTDTLTWDPEGHLHTLTGPAGTNTYIYDAAGDRLLATDPQASTVYLDHTEIRRDTATGQTTATRYYGDAVRTTTDGLTWITTDHHGTGQLAINATTLATTRRRSTPFGEQRGTPPASWPDRKGFVGGTTDPTGLTHLGAREYDPTTGRFISPDPLVNPGEPQTLHAYAYANNSPITYTDPDGLAPCGVCGGGGGGGGAAVGGRVTHVRVGGGAKASRPNRSPHAGKRYQGGNPRAEMREIRIQKQQARQRQSQAQARPRTQGKSTSGRPKTKGTKSSSRTRSSSGSKTRCKCSASVKRRAAKAKSSPKGRPPATKVHRKISSRPTSKPKATPSRGPDGRFRANPTPSPNDATYARVTLRNSTKKAIRDAQLKDSDGNFVDLNTGQSVPASGPFHYGHRPGFEYRRNREMARLKGWSRKEFVEFENDPSHYWIEDPYNNMSHQYEMP